MTLSQALKEAQQRNTAIGHFNIADVATLRAIFESALEVSSIAGRKIPVLIGVSEGEREAIGTKNAAYMVRSLREANTYPIFINADHTHSLEKVKEAAEAGFDEILFDGGKLPLEDNIKATKEVVSYVKFRDHRILVEGELGYIGSSSMVFKQLPQKAEIGYEAITKAQHAARFLAETGVDLLAPAVGNVHGMFANAPNPALFIERIKEISDATHQLPLVLHGGSGISDSDFIAAIRQGMRVVHISTELRRAWRWGMEHTLKESPDEVAPYKLMAGSIAEMKKIVIRRLKLFNHL